MLLAVDIGNTNIVFALCEGKEVVAEWRIRTDAHRTADEYAVWLFTLMQHAGLLPGQVKAAIISSVVPDANFAVKSFIRQHLDCEPQLIASASNTFGMKVLIDNPHELGADRFINAFAAWTQWKQALVIIDFGTATTFDVVSAKGEYLGGVIAPGINLSLEALKKAAAKLHGVAIAHPATVIGRNTTTAMQSGIYYGYAGLIEGIISRIKAELGLKKMKIIATGGLAPLYAEAVKAIDVVDADLTIRGLMLLHAHRTPRKPAPAKKTQRAKR